MLDKGKKALKMIWEAYKVVMCAIFMANMTCRHISPPAGGELHNYVMGDWWVISSQFTPEGWKLHYSWSGLAVLAAILTLQYGYKFIRYLRKSGWRGEKT